MIIYIKDLNGEKKSIDVNGSDTIKELYIKVATIFNYSSIKTFSLKENIDGLKLLFGGKYLTYLDEDKELCIWDFNIQKESTVYVSFDQRNARKEFRLLKEGNCCICLESLKDVDIVGYRRCANNHMIHFECLKDIESCPLCRTKQWEV